MLENDYKLSEAEKAAKKREKIKAKKFSDEECSDIEKTEEETTLKKHVPQNKLNNVQQNGTSSTQKPMNGTTIKPSSKPLKLSTKQAPQRQQETPERIIIQDQRQSAKTFKASDLIKDDKWLKEAIPSTTSAAGGGTSSKGPLVLHIPTPQKYAKGKIVNDTVLTYSQPSMTQGITTLTQSSGNSLSISGLMPSSSSGKTVEIVLEPSKVIPPLPSKAKRSSFTYPLPKKRFTTQTRAEILRRCNHDTERMIGKTFLYEHVCTKGRYLNAIFNAAIDGDLPKFQELFEIGFTYLRTLKSMNLFTNAQLKRKLILNLLRLLVDDGTNANLFMLLSCCRRKNDNDDVISCNQLPYKHGYCSMLKFIASFLRVTEIRKILSVKNLYSGRTCLNIASVSGNLCQMIALLEMGALLHTFDDLGYSPLHYIIRKPRMDMFLEYCFWGADLSIQYSDDRRPNKVVIIIFPFEYLIEDYIAPAHEPEIKFFNIEQKLEGEENAIELIDGTPKYVEAGTTLFELGYFKEKSIFNNVYAFKLLPNSFKSFNSVQAYIVGPEKMAITLEVDGQWPEGHRLRDTLLIGNEYVRLDPKRLPKDFSNIKKTKYAEEKIATKTKAGNKKKKNKSKINESTAATTKSLPTDSNKSLPMFQREMKKKKAD
uniref:ANK_REP_REGION domain-containing protein n=1 Tax=Panagrolaimus sp. PS1159 TaxID=55785 RepID=A0AC35FAJ2_9BILA